MSERKQKRYDEKSLPIKYRVEVIDKAEDICFEKQLRV